MLCQCIDTLHIHTEYCYEWCLYCYNMMKFLPHYSNVKCIIVMSWWGDDVSNHQPHHCLLNRLFRRKSKKISKLRVTGLCEGNSLVTGEFPAQRASNAENISIWWHHQGMTRHPDSPAYQLFFFPSSLISKETSKLHITDPLWWESNSDWWIPFTNGPVMQKVFPLHDVIMNSSQKIPHMGYGVAILNPMLSFIWSLSHGSTECNIMFY